MGRGIAVDPSRLYDFAQNAWTALKLTVLSLLENAPGGLRNVDIGTSLGIYGGHRGHQGHVSRTILEELAQEGLVYQDRHSKRWYYKSQAKESNDQ